MPSLPPPPPAPSGRPPPSLGLYLLIGLLLRLPAVFFAEGYAFVDQQYQSIDPAWHLASGEDWLETHEWNEGLRSWVYPGMLAGLFRALEAVGLEDPLLRMTGVRAAHAVVGLVPLLAFWLVVVSWRPLRRPWPALLFFAASGAVVHAGVQPSGPTFAAGLSAAAVLLFLGPGAWAAWLSGLLLGLAFACCPQVALFGPVLLGAALLAREGRKAARFSLGCAVAILGQGVVDAATWGSFLHSPLAYLRFNVLEGRSAQWDTEPWWYYLLAGVVPYAMLLPPFLRAGAATLRRAARVLALPLAAAAFFVLVHSLIPRKSMRFLLPAFVLLSAALAVGLYAAPVRGLALWHRRLAAGSHVALLVVISLYPLNRGPVRAAAALGEYAAFQGDLTVVDGGPVGVGGFYYLSRPDVDIDTVRREDVDDLLRVRRRRPLFLLVPRAPLSAAELGGRPARLLGEFTNVPDLSDRRRRWVYVVP